MTSFPQRRSIRLQGYDYRQAGAYFITICARSRDCLFGSVVGSEVQLSPCGRLLREEWLRTPLLRPNVDLDAWVIMPNHLHGIIVLSDARATQRVAPTTLAAGSIGAVISHVKSAVTKRARTELGLQDLEIWQRGYFEHIIRTEDELARIREYISDNPLGWADDEENPTKRGAAQRAAPGATSAT